MKKIAIRYYSRTGNTEKLAKELAQTIGVEAYPLTKKIEEDVDILFLGSSIYAAGIDEEVKKFIRELDVKIGKVVNFSTSALFQSTKKSVGKLLGEKNIKLDDRDFYCKGSFGLIHKGHPNSEDLENIKKFAKEIIDGD